MRLSFKQYLGEDSTSQGLQIAADFLDTDQSKLTIVGGEEENEVLETGKEIKNKFIKMVHGNMIVRLFKALGKLFARIEYPDGENKTYKVKTA